MSKRGQRAYQVTYMLFNSIPFLLFFPTVCFLYYCIPSNLPKARNLLLLAASYYFYMNWEPAYALLLLTSTVVTYLAALGISHHEDKRKKKFFLVFSLVLNLAMLFLFKYYILLQQTSTRYCRQTAWQLACQTLACYYLSECLFTYSRHLAILLTFTVVLPWRREISRHMLYSYPSSHS